MLDVVFLSRLQFALTVMFHYLFPPLTIGLGGVIVVLEGQYLRTREPIYEVAARFWTRVFAVNFAMGVATGIVMEFQFGTNWAAYSRFVGDVFGSALAAEGIFAFFLESGFLAVLVFGWERVSPRMHFFSAVMVAIGSAFSAVWIVVANSWQQTPAGYHLVTRNGVTRAELTSFWKVVFNPSSMTRLAHVLVGAFVLGAFFVMSISAWYVLRKKHLEFARRSFANALGVAMVATLLALATGDHSGELAAKYQPTKLAAMEAYFKTAPGPAPLVVFGWPNQQTATVKYKVKIPGALSFLVHKDFTMPVPGLEDFPRDEWPPVVPTYLAFHVMVGIGCLLILLSMIALWLLFHGTLFANRAIMWCFVFAVGGAYAANQAGWITAEVGRQPWSVYRLLRTSDSVSKVVHGSHVLASIILFGIVYALLFAVWVYVMNDKIQHGPEAMEAEPPPKEGWFEAAARLEAPGGESLTQTGPGTRG